jgi:hypothetical protein
MQLRHECIKTILVIQLLSPIIGRNWFLDCMLEFWILCFYSCWCYCVITPTNPSSGPMSKWHVGKLRSTNQLHYFENLPDNWVDIYIHPVIRFNVLMVTVLFMCYIFCTRQHMNGSFWRTRVWFWYGQILYTTWVRGPTRMAYYGSYLTLFHAY